MTYSFAPLEGLTDSVYRRVHHAHFPGCVDKYYMPFLSPTVHRSLTPRECRELPIADTVGFFAVPQLLTKVPEDFLWAAEQCAQRGYKHVNLNLGCPSGTVTAKGKGAGMLRDPESLDRFLNAIFAGTPLPISVKTRLGFDDPAEFPRLLDIFNQYPVEELIVHPRIRNAFYSGGIDMEMFDYAYENSLAPVCFNGDLTSPAQVASMEEKYPRLSGVMLGRGLIGDPGMLLPEGTRVGALEAFMTHLLEEYSETFGSPRNAMFRLKENWRYLLCRFEGAQRLGRQLRKTVSLAEYKAITAQIFHTLPLAPQLQPDWIKK